MSSEQTSAPYTSDVEYLFDELRRVEMLVRAQVRRWRTDLADLRVEKDWATGILDQRELDRFLEHEFVEPLDDSGDDRTASKHDVAKQTELARMIAERVERTEPTALRIPRLADAFGLEQVDIDVLLICLLAELDARYRRLFAYLADEQWRKLPSVGLLAEIVRPPAHDLPRFRRRFAPDAPLVRNHLVRLFGESPGTADDGLATQSVKIDPRIAAFLGGEDYFDEDLDGAACLDEPMEFSELVLTEERYEELLELARWCRNGGIAGVTLALLGAPGSGRRSVARCIGTYLDIPLMVVDVPAVLPTGLAFARHVYREARLRGAAVLWRDCSMLVGRAAEEDRLWADLLGRAAEHTQPTFVDHAQPWDPPPGRQAGGWFLRVPCPSPDLDERRVIWTELLDGVEWAEPAPDIDVVADGLACTFLLTPGRMREALTMSADLATQRDPRESTVTVDDLVDACRRQSSRRLMSFARRVEAPSDMNLDEIVLPDENKQRLIALRDRITNRPMVEQLLGPGRSGPKGLVVMFAGSSGTGKTLAAGLLAKDLGRDLLKVDLAQVVSKWVGETEKNLDRVLSEAQDAHAILFFDEAEALFGKRGTVTDARDKYALQETSFLLQRIEEYEGVVILATNLRQNLDEAFSRRIHVIIEFPMPDEEARLKMWHLHLTHVDHQLSEVDIERLAATYKLSAAAIAQVIATARYLTISETAKPPSLTFGVVQLAANLELQRTGLPISSAPAMVD